MYNESAYALGSVKSYIRGVFEYGLQQRALVGPENVFDYSLGNPSIPAPAQVNESIHRILDTEDSVKLHGYTTACGYDGLREAVAKNLTERFHMDIQPKNLFFTCGAAPALIAALQAVHIDADTEIIAIAPYFVEYPPFVEATGSKFVAVRSDEQTLTVDLAELEEKLNAHTQAIILNSPCNPSGVVYSRALLEQIAELLTKKSAAYGHPIYLIADEPYRELVYDGVEVPFIPSIYPNTIVCYSWSKSLSLPGERLGYVLVADCVEDAEKIYFAVAGAARVNGHVNPPSLIQRVVAECCQLMPDLAAYDENRRLLCDSLRSYGYTCVEPQGAFYLFVKAPGGDAMAFSELTKKHNLLIVPSDPFGMPGYFRLSYCVSNEMIRRSLPIFKELYFD